MKRSLTDIDLFNSAIYKHKNRIVPLSFPTEWKKYCTP